MNAGLRGSANPSAVLNSAAASAILVSPDSREVLARRYGVSVSCIDDVQAGRTWSHILPALRRRGGRDHLTLNLDLAGGRAA